MRVTRVAVYRRYTNGLTEWTVNSGNTTLCVNQNVHILFLNNSMKTSVSLNRFDVHKWFRTYLPYLTKCHTVPCEMQSSCIWSKLCCFPPKSEGFSITSCFVMANKFRTSSITGIVIFVLFCVEILFQPVSRNVHRSLLKCSALWTCWEWVPSLGCQCCVYYIIL